MTDSELKNCPFCGEKPKYKNAFPDTELGCPKCKQAVIKARWYRGDLGLVEACWNTRAKDSSHQLLVDALEELKSELHHLTGDLWMDETRQQATRLLVKAETALKAARGE